MSELIILLGEGNFSFALEFVRLLRAHKCLDSIYEVLASDRSPAADTKTCDNIRRLIADYGIRIWTDLDGRLLHRHPRLVPDLRLAAAELKRVHIIFNFPHVPAVKMRIDLNRALLRDTFASAAELACHHCHGVDVLMYVSLCHGQSGLNPVEPKHRHRAWADSWQLTEMAAHGNFVLVNVGPFSSRSFRLLFCDDQARQQMIYEANFRYQQRVTTTSLPPQQSQQQFQDYEPFGYRQQDKPFRTTPATKSFEGGNVFVFQHRHYQMPPVADMHLLRSRFPHPFASNPLVRRLFDDVRQLAGDQQVVIQPYLMERLNDDHCCTQPLDVYILSVTLVTNHDNHYHRFRAMATAIGRYLRPSYVQDLLTDDLVIDDIRFGFFSRNTAAGSAIVAVNLLVENCLRIKWSINDVRILYSKYFQTLSSSGDDDDDQKRSSLVASTGSLYPQTFYRDLSFWWHGPEPLETKDFFRLLWDHLEPTNLRSVHLRDKYLKSPTIIGYCYRLVIQSVDIGLDRHKVHQLLGSLGSRLTDTFPQIIMR